jgi:hypothetical protein
MACVPSQTFYCACTTLVFSDWGACSSEGYQTRTLIHKEPERCIATLGTSNFRRECSPPGLIYTPANTQQSPQACEVRFQYHPATPTAPGDLAPMPVGCDAAGVELAVAVMLARLLGSPPTP